MSNLSIQPSAQHLLQAQLGGQRLAEGVALTHAANNPVDLIETRRAYSQEQAAEVASSLLNRLTRIAHPSAALVNTASNFLQVEIARHRVQLDLGLKPNEKNKYFMHLGLLDRMLAAIQIRGGQDVPYQTRISNDLFQKWQRSQDTYAAKKAQLKAERLHAAPDLRGQLGSVLSPADAERAFHFHPEQVDFVLRNHLHKQAGRFDEGFQVNEHGEILIKLRGVYTPVSRILMQVVENHGKLCNIVNQKMAYRPGQGLTEFDPCTWVELPVFRTKARHTHDYRIDVHTVLQNGSKHMWLEMKDPEGHIYNVGSFFKSEEFTQPIERIAETIQGRLVAGDIHEFLYQGELKDTLRTSYIVTPEQFARLKANIEAYQAQPFKPYNLITHNCCSWTREMLATIGIEIPTQMTLTELTLGAPSLQWIFKIPILGWFCYAIYWVVSVLRNLLLCAIGGGNIHIEEEDLPQGITPAMVQQENGRMFRNIEDILDPNHGLLDHPKRYRDFQKRQGRVHVDARGFPIPVSE